MIRKKFALITFNDTGTSQIVPSSYIFFKNEHNKYRPITNSTESFDNVVIFNENKKLRLIKITCFGDTHRELLNSTKSDKRIRIKKRRTFSPTITENKRQKKVKQNNMEKKKIANDQKQLTAASSTAIHQSDAHFLDQLQDAEEDRGQSSPAHLSLSPTPPPQLYLQSQQHSSSRSPSSAAPPSPKSNLPAQSPGHSPSPAPSTPPSPKSNSPAQSPGNSSSPASSTPPSPKSNSPAQTPEHSPSPAPSTPPSPKSNSPAQTPEHSPSPASSTTPSPKSNSPAQSPEELSFKLRNSSKVSQPSHQSRDSSDNESEGEFVTRKGLRQDLITSGKYIIKKIIAKLETPGLNRDNPIAERRGLPPIENNMVEVSRGIFIDSTELMKAIHATSMRMRGNHIIRGFWPAEVRKYLVAKRRSNQPQMREITAAEYYSIESTNFQVCQTLQNKHPLKVRKGQEPTTKNIRKWAIDLLKNDRRKKDEQTVQKQRQRAAQRRQKHAKESQAARQLREHAGGQEKNQPEDERREQ